MGGFVVMHVNRLWKKPLTYVILVVVGLFISGAALYRHYRPLMPSDVSVVRAAVLQGNLLLQNVFPESFRSWEVDTPDPKDIERGIHMGADWLLSMQNPEGRFQYWYDPVENRYSAPDDDNFLRQAGTAYAMALAYEQSGAPKYLDSVQRAISYQLKFIKHLDGDKAFFMFRSKAKLGGTALPMLTMLKLRELTGTREFDTVLKPCAEMILYLQEKYDSGQYKSTYVYNGKYDHEKRTGWESRIYPGEAMLALSFMYKTFGDERYRQSIDRAYGFYYLKDRWMFQSYLPWTISAMAMMFDLTGDKTYADYAVVLTDQLLSQQILNPFIAEVGGFHAIPSVNTSAYLEGLGDAVRVAAALKDQDLEFRYRRSMILGMQWILQLQFRSDNPDQYPEPQKALGGFSTRKTLALQRIDNTQHSISALVKGLRVVQM